ncbi:MAG: Valyl-tRNA synthetase, partial [uncultured Friedmanniella sp.]
GNRPGASDAGGAGGEVGRGLAGRGHLPLRPVPTPVRGLLPAPGHRLRLRADRRGRPLPADARPRGLLPDGLGRQRAADRASGAEPLRRAVRAHPAVRPGPGGRLVDRVQRAPAGDPAGVAAGGIRDDRALRRV